MDMTFEDQIRERAYQIWQAGGMADGQAHEHWVSAEQAVQGETSPAMPEVILTKAAKASKPTVKTVKAVAAKTGKISKAVKADPAKVTAKSPRGKAKSAAH